MDKGVRNAFQHFSYLFHHHAACAAHQLVCRGTLKCTHVADPLPVEFHSLRLASALEQPDVSFWGPSWLSVPGDSLCAMREAVRALRNLKEVELQILCGTLAQHCAFLTVFAAGSSIERFAVRHDQRFCPSNLAGFAMSQAFGCFTSLRRLRILRLHEFYDG